MKIYWLGHASFRIETEGKNVYIDPYILPQNSPLADIILITHEHFDHLDKEKIGEIKKPETVIVGNENVAKALGESMFVLDYWESTELHGVSVFAVPAYNPQKEFHPKGLGCGFVVEAEGKRIYHAGDTDLIPDMVKLQKIEVALLPIGGTYTMDINDAVEAALIIKPKIVVPMHYNTLEGLEADVEEFKRKLHERSEGIRVETARTQPLEL